MYIRDSYDRFGCPEGIYFKVSDRDGLFHAQQEFGCHTASVFGDYTAELKEPVSYTNLDVYKRQRKDITIVLM